MSPREPDPFKPQPGDNYSKSQVNKAGRGIRKIVNALASGDLPATSEGRDELVHCLRVLEWWRSQHARPLSTVASGLRYHVGRETDGSVDATQRLKKSETMISKLMREPTMAMTQMHDIGGVRARLGNLQELRTVSRRLRKTWSASIIRTRDYVAQPKSSGYRAIHHSVRRHGYVTEVQLRTFRQDAWANQVENDGRDLAVGFKFGRGAEEVHGYYRAVSEVFAYLDRDEEIPNELRERLNVHYRIAAPLLHRV